MKRVALLILLSTSACHSDTNDKLLTNTEPAASKKEVIAQDIGKSAIESQKTKLKELNIQRSNELFTEKISFKLNNEKFTAEKTILHIGDRVYNLLMSEFGGLKGSFVVVTLVDATELIFPNYKSELIAANTFRLVPIAADSPLVELYNQLKKEKKFSRVEIEIDYSKQNSQSAY